MMIYLIFSLLSAKANGLTAAARCRSCSMERTVHSAYMDSIGCTGFSTPVVYDLNGDGRDEAIISVNNLTVPWGSLSKSPDDMENKLMAIDFAKNAIGNYRPGPWL